MNSMTTVKKKQVMPGLEISVDEYAQILAELKAQVQQVQVTGVLSVKKVANQILHAGIILNKGLPNFPAACWKI